MTAAPPAAWPYPPPPPRLQPGEPTWVCPDAICACATPHEEPHEPIKHTVFLHDDASRRMPGARCRVTVRGVVVPEATQADGTGAVEVELPAGTRTIVVEWAPADTPIDPKLPYRRVLHVVLDGSDEDGVRRRLEHVGVSRDTSLEQRIRAFQEAYGLAVDGQVASVAGPLRDYHDMAMLPPLAGRPPEGFVPPLPPDVRPPSQSAASAVSDRDGDCHLSFKLVDAANQPIANEPFVLALADGRELAAATDGAGLLEYESVRAGDYLLRIRERTMYLPALKKAERHRPFHVRTDG